MRAIPLIKDLTQNFKALLFYCYVRFCVCDPVRWNRHCKTSSSFSLAGAYMQEEYKAILYGYQVAAIIQNAPLQLFFYN